MSVAANLAAVRARIAKAAEAAGREAAAVTLVAVSKRQPVEAIREAYAAGQRDFGENYVQELAEKRAALADLAGIRWHFIGHLQSRKARELADGTVVVQGLDSASALAKLSEAGAAAGARVPVFVQVNIGDESSKSGLAVDAVEAFAADVAAAPGLDWRGLMTIPPAVGDAAAARPYFRRMRALRDTLSQRFGRPLALSMGMSGDFEAAVAEGADLVRVGTAVFGERPSPRV